MFTESSDIYDLVYSFKDYKKESADITQIIKAHRPNGKTILDVGCGTSEHHKYLSKEFSLDGMDLNEKFIQISQQKNPVGHYFLANMMNFDLKKEYDVIMCLFSSIGYLESNEEIVKTLKCFSKHLRKDGLILVEPWFTKETWSTDKVQMLTVEQEGRKICRMNKGETSGDFSILNFHYLIGTVDQGVKHLHEQHKLRLSSQEEIMNAFNEADLAVKFEDGGLIGRGMYFGTKKN